jgi:2-polyprenyl-6-methoxyphenol hydroxylase-like FAD-dependent oxidoreductase
MTTVIRACDFDVIIAGAGVGGAACALALAHAHGLRILLVERHAGPGNLNRGESLLPPVTALLRRWGALDKCRAAGARTVSRMQFFHHRAGLVLDVPLTLPDVRDPYLVLPHPAIERVFVEAAEATGRVEIHYRTRLLRLLEEGGRVCGAVLCRDGGAEQRVRARVVIGADGAASVVRAGLGIELARTPYDHGLFIVDVDRPEGLPDVLRTELHPDGGILVVPGTGRLGLAALVRREHEHLFRSGSVQEKFSRIEERSPLLRGRQPSPVGVHLYKLWRGHAPRYWARGAVLIGDAIHVINPVMAQGMTMAIEDAAALARHLGPALEAALEAGASGPALDERLAAYERERRPFNAAVIRRSHWMSLIFALGGPVGDVLHRRACQLADSAMGRLLQQRVWSCFATSPEAEYA